MLYYLTYNYYLENKLKIIVYRFKCIIVLTYGVWTSLQTDSKFWIY